MKTTGWYAALSVRTQSSEIIDHAGATALRLGHDWIGVTDGLIRALARKTLQPCLYFAGVVVRDLAVMLA